MRVSIHLTEGDKVLFADVQGKFADGIAKHVRDRGRTAEGLFAHPVALTSSGRHV
jgi:hypothetical protein